MSSRDCPRGIPSLRPPSRFSATISHVAASPKSWAHHHNDGFGPHGNTYERSSMASGNVSILQPKTWYPCTANATRLVLLTSSPAHSLLSLQDMPLSARAWGCRRALVSQPALASSPP